MTVEKPLFIRICKLSYVALHCRKNYIAGTTVYTCVTCKEIVRTVRESKGTERHSRVTVADLGHVGSMSHKYRTQCTKCGYSVDVIVPCAGH